MNKFARLALILSGLMLFESGALATTVPNTETPTTFVGPVVKGSFTNRLVEDKAYSLSGEAGPRNVRIGGTYAWKITDAQRFKLSIEYLWQNIIYSYFSGNTSSWMNQYAAGGAYQYDFTAGARMHPQLNINAYFSHAATKDLGNILGIYTNPQGVLFDYNNLRRVAGSTTFGISPGIAISPWRGGRLTVALNYDRAHYNFQYQPDDENSAGFGGTLGVKQIITNYLGIGLTAAVRKPFNTYNVDVSFARIPCLHSWTVGLFGSYTVGKFTLPSTWDAGITADYYLDQSRDDADNPRARYPVTNSMLVFAKTPAAYMPQVLADPDGLLLQSPVSG
jgi:hypothetical protein